MTKFIALDDGTIVSQKQYVELLFEQHKNKATWQATYSSRRLHFTIEHTDFSPTICNRLLATKDLFTPDDSLNFSHCKVCEKAISKLS